MDFDLFELDDDDDIFTAALEATQQQESEELLGTIPEYPEFQCAGEDTLTSQFSAEGFIRNAFIGKENANRKNQVTDEILLTDYDFKTEHMQQRGIAEYVFGDACMNMQYLLVSVRSGAAIPLDPQLTYYQRRRQITQLLHMLLHNTQNDQWQQLSHLRLLLNRITEPDIWKLIYFSNSSKGNDCNVPAYHLLHGALEWKLLDLCILHKYDVLSQQLQNSSLAIEDKLTNSIFVSQLERIFDDLIACSLYVFAKKNSAELLSSSPFPCTCFKEFWLLLQLALDKWCTIDTDEKLNFWSLFNKAVGRIKSKMEYFALKPLSFCEYANWMITALTRLFGYRLNGQYEGPNYTRASVEKAENYEFYESCTQEFLNCNPTEEQLRIYICLLSPTLLQWWRPKVNIPMLLWEHFHKRLNTSFYIAGAAPSNLAVACNSGRAYIDKYRTLLSKHEQQPDANLCSFTLFTLLLGKILERLLKSNTNHHAQKLLGRIYTKFSLQKFLALNETGIHHLIELFLVLALCGDFADLAPKLRDKLLSIAFDKVTTSRQIAVAKGHMALLILNAEQHLDISEYVSKLLQQLQSVRNDLAVSKIIADALLDVFVQADDFRRGEYLLIDAWLPNLLNNFTPAEQDRTLQALHLIFVKLERDHFVEGNANLFKALNSFILPFLKQQYVTNFSAWLPQLAADFCIQLATAGDTQNFQKLFSYFSEAQTANRQALPQFLLKILECNKSAAYVQPMTIMHVWLKSLVLLTALNEEVVNLTKIVVQLPAFRMMTALDENDVIIAKEPLCVFVAAVGKTYDASDYQQRCQIADNFNAYLRNFERWLQPDLKLEKSELAFRFYSFLAIVIYNCPHIVYAKSKITCFFHIAITRFVLPTSIQVGKPPESKLAQLIHKVWPVLVQGIGRLSFKSDAYINKTLNDLIQKWTPHFKISTNAKLVARPFITCLQGDNYELSLFIFEKLTGMFLATHRRQADPNACLVITIFQEAVAAIEISSSTNVAATNVRRLETLMKGTCLLTLEHIMMVDEIVPSRGLLLEYFRRLVGCSVYRNTSELKSLLAEHLRIITKKHLAYYTFFYFELLTKLTQISCELVEQIMDFLRSEVRIVEQKRGAGEDNRIRGCLLNLQQSIAAEKNKRV